MAKKEIPSPEVLRQLLRYDAETGKLFWKERGPEWFEGGSSKFCRRWNTRYAGRLAMNSKANAFGHLGGTLFNSSVHAHRVIWALVTGFWPEGPIDHINGKPSDNRLCNLRVTTSAGNSRNRSLSVRNTSGHIGVNWNRKMCRWIASIRVDGKSVYLGSFGCSTAAQIVRKAASARHGYHENHGRLLKRTTKD